MRRADSGSRRWVQAILLLIVVAAMACSWLGRWSVNQDGLSYLDIAQAYADGRWSDATNAYWSPLYSWVLAVFLAVVQPARLTEVAWVKGLNLGILLLVLVCFRRFLAAFPRTAAPAVGGAPESEPPPHEGVGRLIAYGLLGWAVLALVSPLVVGADLLVVAIFLELVTQMMTLRHSPQGWPRHALFGVLLGLGYLAKAALLPLGAVFLGATYLRNPHRRPRHVVLATAALLLIAAPYAAVISAKIGRPTTGEVGRLAYAWLVNGVREVHWQGEDPGSGTPRHPTRQVSADPHMFEFESPVPGAYPVWYDKAYWNDGVEARFDVKQQAQALRRNLATLVGIAFRRVEIALLVAGLYLAALWRWRRGAGGRLRSCVPILVACLATIGLYSLVHVESRYLATPLLLVWICGIHLLGAFDAAPAQRGARARLAAGCFAGLIVVAAAISCWRGIDTGSTHQDVARELSQHGVPPGARVAYVGRTLGPYWARVASVKIVADMRLDAVDAFWKRSRADREAALQRLAALGDGFIVAQTPPVTALEEGWEPLGSMNYALRRFPR